MSSTIRPASLFDISLNSLLQLDQTAFNHENYAFDTIGRHSQHVFEAIPKRDYKIFDSLVFLFKKSLGISSFNLAKLSVKINKIVLLKAIIHSEKTFNINRKDNEGWTLFKHAMIQPEKEIISYLFEKGAVIDRTYLKEFFDIKDIKVIQSFLNKTPSLFEMKEVCYYDTYMHNAIRECGDNTITDLVKFLATTKPELLALTNNNLQNSAHLAVRIKNFELLKFILKLNPSLADTCTTYGNTPLHLAVIENQDEMVEFLLENYPRMARNKNSSEETPFELALRKGGKKILSLFVNKNPKLINYRDEDDNPAVFLAAKSKNFEAALFFLEQNQCRAEKLLTSNPYNNCINRITGRTIVHLAVDIKAARLLLLLLEKLPFDLIYAPDKKGIIPHDLVKENQNTAVARLLRDW